MGKQNLSPLFINRLSYVVFFNVLIATFIYFAGIYNNFTPALVISQCVGISSNLCVWLLALLCKNPRADWGWYQGIIGVVFGSVFGSVLGLFLIESSFSLNDILNQKKFYIFMSGGIWYGLMVTYFFLTQDKMFFAKEELHRKQIHILENEKNLVELQLNALQAQIEPHFLFNTLSNILSLIETNPKHSHAMLEHFILYLRGTLDSTRENTIELAEEVNNVTAYLDVIKFRMGDRLKANIEIPKELSQIKIPPMLLLNLVENSIKHGLEPKVDGGTINIIAEKNSASIIITIEDTGMGIQDHNSNSGIGLSNTRERLALFSRNDARMTIEQNQPQGTRVTINLPEYYQYG